MPGYVENIYVSIYLYICHGGDHSKKSNCIGFTPVSRDHWNHQETIHQCLHAKLKLKVFAKNATENTVVMINEVNSLLPKVVKVKLENWHRSRYTNTIDV